MGWQHSSGCLLPVLQLSDVKLSSPRYSKNPPLFSAAQGKAQFSAGGNMQLIGWLELDRMDPDRYLMLTSTSKGSDFDFQLSTNIEGLRELQLDLAVMVDELILNEITVYNLLLKVQSSEGEILLNTD